MNDYENKKLGNNKRGKEELSDRDKVQEILIFYKKWAYNNCEYNDEEARSIVVSELESEIRELEEKIRIMKLAKERVQDEGL